MATDEKNIIGEEEIAADNAAPEQDAERSENVDEPIADETAAEEEVAIAVPEDSDDSAPSVGNDAAEALNSEIEALNSRLSEINAEIAAGEKALSQKQEKLEALNTEKAALDVKLDSLLCGDINADELIAPYLSKSETADFNALIEEKTAVENERKEIRARIAELEALLPEYSVEPGYREAVNAAAVLVVAINEGANAITQTDALIEHAESRLETIKGDYENNEATLYICQKEYDEVFGALKTEKRTLAGLATEENELVKKRQGLFHDQITGANLMQEINAIDISISDNTAAIDSSEDSLKALDSAKKTLLIYANRCDVLIKKKSEELSVILGEKKFFERLDALKYGDRCPVCSGKVSEQADCGQALADIIVKEKDAKEELKKLTSIAKEYRDKLDKINIHLGAYDNAKKSARRFLEGLKLNKASKLAELKKILSEHNVSSHAELSDKLERVVERINLYNSAMTEINGIGAREEAARKSNEELGARIEELVTKTIPEAQAKKAKHVEDLAAAENELKGIREGFIGDADPIALMQENDAKHAKEVEINTEINELYKKKITVNEKLEELTGKIAACDIRSGTFVKDGREMSYSTLCATAATEKLAEVLSSIRAIENSAKQVREEIDGLNRTVFEKRTAALKIYSELQLKSAGLPVSEAQ